MEEEWSWHLLYTKILLSPIFLKRGQSFCRCVRDTTSSWTLCATFKALRLLFWQNVLNQPWFSIYQLNWPLQAEIDSRLRLKTDTAHISRGHPYISFHNTHTFLFNHVTASTYFHRCILWRESWIDGLVKGPYVTDFYFISMFKRIN